MSETKHLPRRLLLVVGTLNVAGLACMSAAAGARDPLAGQSQSAAGDVSSALGSIGFTLMLPGSFFAASTFVCAHALLWTDAAARLVWYGTAVLINLLLAWKFGAPYEAARFVN